MESERTEKTKQNQNNGKVKDDKKKQEKKNKIKQNDIEENTKQLK